MEKTPLRYLWHYVKIFKYYFFAVLFLFFSQLFAAAFTLITFQNLQYRGFAV
jgi:hypothetical protein